MKKIVFYLFLATFISSTQAQTNKPFWVSAEETQVTITGERTIIPKKYKVFHLEEGNLKTSLFSAPSEKEALLKNSQVVIELPFPDGSLKKFRVVESSVMAPELANQFPDIKAFNVQGIDDESVYGKLDWTDFGFHAMIRDLSGDIFIDPYSRNNTSDYIIYYAADFEKDAARKLPEIGVINPKTDKKKENISENGLKNNRAGICAGENLRTYRLAIACTGEYAQAATGLTNPGTSQILSAIVTTVIRINSVYETEVAVKLVLVANETSVLYSDFNSDPFSGNNNATILINESQMVIDNNIGNANYDIGHTFSTGGGGLAYLGCVCSFGKARGITGNSYPVGDPFDIDYVAHEMGHQFNGNHSFNECGGNENAGTQVEPGSGVTIMGYAGLCGWNDLSNHSIAYFHTINFDEIMDFITIGNGGSCPVITATGNTAPVVTCPAGYIIPNATPFILTGSVTDIDGDVLTYQWEEIDNGFGGDWDLGNTPYFRSYIPVSSPTRMFPELSVVLSGNYTGTIGEYLSSNPETLNFRLIARDNKIGGGGLCYANTEVIIDGSGPFEVSYPNTTGIVWASNSSQTVTWNVNGTNSSPVSCTTVNILISIDGGATFTMLLANTPNDGSQLVIVPIFGITQTTCRIEVESAGNIFFDINDKNFTINVGSIGISEYSGSNAIQLNLQPNPFNNEIQLTLNGMDKNEKTHLIIYDILGNILMTDEYTGKEELTQKYNLSFLSNGVYIIELSNNKQKLVSRLVKQ